MTPEIAQFTNRGMNQDISVSKATNEFAFKNYNIRITAVNDNTLLSITNEKLPKELKNISISYLKNNKIHYDWKGNLTSEYPVKSDVLIKVGYSETDDPNTYYEDIVLPAGKKHVVTEFIPEMLDFYNVVSPLNDGVYNYYTEYDETPEEIVETEEIVEGSYLGHAVINNYLIIFTKGDYDRIYRIELKEDTIYNTLLYKGNLNFSLNKPLETLSYYESEDVQKVYWVDGENQPRVINIVGKNVIEGFDTQFDFNPTVNKFPNVTITKEYSGTGLFPAGVIQYFVSYYNKFGAETGIVWSSDLQYVTEYNRAAGPDENVVCSFKINIDNVDTTYEYARVYSMQRTSLNTTPICRIVADVNINNSDSISVVDTNTNTETIDPTQLLFLGGDTFIASTLAQKDDVLFLGDLTIDNIVVPQEVKDLFTIPEGELANPYLGVIFTSRSNGDNKTFKRGEWYRVGIQFQDTTTKWTIPIFVGDIQIPENGVSENTLPSIIFDLNGLMINDSTAQSKLSIYNNFRLVMVETNDSTRNILAQGVVTPTVFNHAERVNNSGPYSIASWIMRPRNGNAQFEHLGGLGNIVTEEEDEKKYINLSTCEIQNSLEALPSGSYSDGSDLTNNYYVDSSILNFYSPETERVKSLLSDKSLKFRIIGVAPIHSSTSDIILETSTDGYSSDSGLVKNSIVISRNPDEDSTINDSFIRRPVYKDALFNNDGSILPNSVGKYFVYLWHKEGSIIGQTSDSTDRDNNPLNSTYADLSHKIIANKRTSNYSIYFSSTQILNYGVLPIVFNSDVVESKVLNLSENKSVIYQGNYDTLVTSRTEGLLPNSEKEDFSYRVFFSEAKVHQSTGNRPGSGGTSSPVPIDRNSYTYANIKQYSPVRIKYKTTPHITFALNSLVNSFEYKLLPYLSSNNEVAWNLANLYPSEYFITPDTPAYAWLSEGEFYSQDSIADIEIGKNPYLYIGEIYRDRTVNELYGNPTQENLEKHNWIPISKSMKIGDGQLSMGYVTRGDTYYQLWDCLSSYPFTEEDLNSVVDITSFYVETHINLKGRYDKHKIIEDILTARKTNFNLINPVYSQTDNYFTYNIIDEKFNQTEYGNQVAFSLQKTPTSDIDTWCNITLASSFNLNGLYGKLTKLINVNDSILAFQDKALSVINFNNRTALSTENGIPIEIANSGKVNGYSVISSNIGCQNKQSICQASSGVYFIDDYNKTMYGFNKEGLADISSKGMSIWFKKNLTGKEKTFYDSLTNDIYVTNANDCLVFNEGLQAFTSFMDYNNINALFNFNGYSLMLDKDSNGLIVPMKMFSGKYANDYYIQYKINPEPLVDKTFTNIEYIADCFKAEDSIDGIYSSIIKDTYNILPFTGLTVWTEYQKGSSSLDNVRFRFPNIEKKFRVWRTDIPRDDSNQRDRIRNPWMYLRLSKSEEPQDIKMVFHNLLVKYYK